MSPIRIVWLLLCALGIVLPLSHFIPWLAANDWSVRAMIDAWQANGSTRGLLADLSVTALTLVVWIVWDCRRRHDRIGLIAIPMIVLVGVSLALPLHLFLRSR